MANMFDKVKAQTASKPKAKGKAKPEYAVEDLRMYAALKAAQKTIETMVDTLKESVNEQALELFLKRKDPKAFQGVDGDTTASLQLRKRSSRSVLSEAELAVLKEAGVDTVKSQDSKFYINYAYADDQELLGKVSEALEGIVPEDFFGHTGDKYIVGDDALSQAMKIAEEDTRREVVKVVGTQAARTKFGGDHDEMLAILDKVLKG